MQEENQDGSDDTNAPENDDDSQTVPTPDEEILRVARERFQISIDAESELRTKALDDLKFSNGEQWDDAELRNRQEEGRPALTINRIPQFVRQIANDIRQNRPAIKISPVDNKADVETAKILQGMIRHIEYSSNADTAYDMASDMAARIGFGFWRIITDYSDPMSFTQDIMVKAIPDPFSVRLDPSSRELDGSDANWAFVEERMPMADFKATYPNSEISTTHSFDDLEKAAEGWVDKSSVRVTEYFWKEFKPQKIYRLSNDSVVDEDDLEETVQKLQAQGVQVKVVDKRDTLIPCVYWAKINGLEVLEKTEFPAPWIPIVPHYGEQLIIDGKRVLNGIVHNAKDSQRMYNFYVSSETEQVGLAPKAPWIIAEGTIEGHEAKWRNINRKTFAYVPYKPVFKNGTMLPPPSRVQFEPAIQAITQGRQLASEDMKATTGIYDAALGAQANETSGVAIQRRTHQTQTSNFHIVDNLSKSIRHSGRIKVAMIPKVYDTPRVMRVLGEDGTEDMAVINQMFEKDGEQKCYDVGAGRYDVTVSSGPSFETKRQEAAQTMMSLVQSYPQIMQIAGDLLVKNMDWTNSQEIADRMKKALPPNLQDQPEGQAQIPPQVQQQMGQMQQMISQLTQAVHAAHDKLDKKTDELQTRLQMNANDNQTKLAIAMAQIHQQDSETILEAEMSHIDRNLGLAQSAQDQAQAAQQQPPQGQPPQQQVPSQPSGPQNQSQMPTGGPSPGNNSMGAP